MTLRAVSRTFYNLISLLYIFHPARIFRPPLVAVVRWRTLAPRSAAVRPKSPKFSPSTVLALASKLFKSPSGWRMSATDVVLSTTKKYSWPPLAAMVHSRPRSITILSSAGSLDWFNFLFQNCQRSVAMGLSVMKQRGRHNIRVWCACAVRATWAWRTGDGHAESEHEHEEPATDQVAASTREA